MTNITGNIEPFNKYIHDSSAAIFSEESNSAHDWFREVRCSLSVDGVPCNLLIKEEECTGDQQSFWFNFNLELSLHNEIDKNKAKELICWIADKMQFHPNIKVLDRTEHSDRSGFHGTKVEPQGNNRYFWLHPKGFTHSTELGRYCWEGIPESADRWTSNMFVTVKVAPSNSDEWGCSFDLGPEALDPLNLLRRAIRERDEEIAKKMAAEEARAEADRLAAERALQEQQEAREKLKGFLESIGDFEMHGPSSHDLDCGEAVNWLETWNARIIPFKECWNEFHRGFFVGIGAIGNNRNKFGFEVCLSDGFDENVKKIIKWMVDNGAREPQQACV